MFGVKLGWLPAGGKGTGYLGWDASWKYFVMPALTLGLAASASYLRLSERFVRARWLLCGALLVAAAGAMAGYVIDRSLLGSTRHVEGNRLSGMQPFQAEEGAPIANTERDALPLDVLGTAGNRYWFVVSDEEVHRVVAYLKEQVGLT